MWLILLRVLNDWVSIKGKFHFLCNQEKSQRKEKTVLVMKTFMKWCSEVRWVSDFFVFLQQFPLQTSCKKLQPHSQSSSGGNQIWRHPSSSTGRFSLSCSTPSLTLTLDKRVKVGTRLQKLILLLVLLDLLSDVKTGCGSGSATFVHFSQVK